VLSTKELVDCMGRGTLCSSCKAVYCVASSAETAMQIVLVHFTERANELISPDTISNEYQEWDKNIYIPVMHLCGSQ
jgi:hypothetical protein